MAGHLRAGGESRDAAVAAIHKELEPALVADRLAIDQAWSPEMIDEVVRLAVDSCYGVAEPSRVARLPKPPLAEATLG